MEKNLKCQCGSANVANSKLAYYPSEYVVCRDCGMRTGLYGVAAHATRAWNHRPAMQDLVTELKAARAVILDLQKELSKNG